MLPSPDPYMNVAVDEDILDMIDSFLKNQRDEVEKLKAAAQALDRERCRRIGHTMKGVGGMYGFQWISLAGAAVETAAKENPSQLEGLAEQIDRYLRTVRYYPG